MPTLKGKVLTGLTTPKQGWRRNQNVISPRIPENREGGFFISPASLKRPIEVCNLSMVTWPDLLENEVVLHGAVVSLANPMKSCLLLFKHLLNLICQLAQVPMQLYSC